MAIGRGPGITVHHKAFESRTQLETRERKVLAQAEELLCQTPSATARDWIRHAPDLVQELRLSRVKSHATLVGVGEGHHQAISCSVNLSLGARDSVSPVLSASAYVLPRITGYTPPSFRACDYDALTKLKLADPDPASDHRIEVLLDAELYAEVLKAGILRLSDDGPLAQETIFGWIISGPTITSTYLQPKSRGLHASVLESLDRAIRRFWELEEVPSTSVLTGAEKECETLFVDTVTRDASGQFIVRLPLKSPAADEALEDPLPIALSALSRLRKKLDTNPTLVQEY
ncbi:uncharacterized protein LOC144477604, partial [Augochlora pura]